MVLSVGLRVRVTAFDFGLCQLGTSGELLTSAESHLRTEGNSNAQASAGGCEAA